MVAVSFAAMVIPVAACAGPTNGTATGCESTAPAASPVPGVGATPQPANYGELSKLQGKVEDIGYAFPDVFAGTAMDTDAGKVFVWRKPSKEFDTAVSVFEGGDTIVLLCAAHSKQELDQALRTLQRANEGENSYSLWARHDGSCVEVGTAEPARAQRELGRTYPGYPLCFVSRAERVPL